MGDQIAMKNFVCDEKLGLWKTRSACNMLDGYFNWWDYLHIEKICSLLPSFLEVCEINVSISNI